MKVIASARHRTLKTLAPPESMRLDEEIRPASKDVFLSALDRYIRAAGRDGGPEPEVAENLLAHRRRHDQKAVNHGLSVFE